MLCLATQSCPTLCDPMDCTHQAPLSMTFSRQENWSRLPCPPLGIFPSQGSKPGFLHCRQIPHHLSLTTWICLTTWAPLVVHFFFSCYIFGPVTSVCCFLIFSVSLLKFSLCSSTLHFSLVNIFISITWNSLSDKLLIFVSLRVFLPPPAFIFLFVYLFLTWSIIFCFLFFFQLKDNCFTEFC